MKKFVIASYALAALFLVACGKDEESKENSQQEFKYNLTENQCSTGEQKAGTKEEMCAKLKDDRLNQGCAYTLRKNFFTEQGCGSWTS